MIAQVEQKYSLLEVLDGCWWIGLVAFLTALVAMPIFRAIACRKRPSIIRTTCSSRMQGRWPI
jgi:hypothetical protein